MSTPHDKAAAVAAHTYVSSRKENVWRTRVVTSFNNFVHLPVVEDVCYTSFWLLHCVLGPLYAVGLLLLLAKDALVGAVVPRLEEAKGRIILVTGCDTGTFCCSACGVCWCGGGRHVVSSPCSLDSCAQVKARTQGV